MKRLTLSLFSVSIMAVMPVIAGAAGTYYNGDLYQNPQRYGSANAAYNANRGYGQNQTGMVRNTTTRITKKTSASPKQQPAAKQGFVLGAALTHEKANWNFKMKEAGSKLHYDDLSWNVLGIDGAYYFGSATPVQINFGAKYGWQFGESSMIDDDISNGAYGDEPWPTGTAYGYAISAGKSKDGTQMGFHAGLGLTDFFSVGRVKITPSVGYRYFRHELYTKDNTGLTMDIFQGNSSHPYENCIENDGEMQCDPFVGFIASSGKITPGGRLVDDNGTPTDYTDDYLTDIVIPSGSVDLTLGDTYYYTQAGTSHKYTTVWQGPYIALDMEYVINNDNFVNAGIEFGLPMYNSKGDQPYRIDWVHPTSVEDKSGFGKAYHLGLNAEWSTALSESTMLTLGVTYDYYRAKEADATTYLNSSYYEELALIYAAKRDAATDADVINRYQKAIDVIAGYEADGWKQESKGEIDSIYSSMGVRLGLSVKF